jgi:hypothetical protein
MPRINPDRIVVSRKKAQTIAKKSEDRGIMFGVRLSSVNDSIPAKGMFGKKEFMSKAGITRTANIKKQQYEYQMIVQTVVGKMIKEYKIINPKLKTQINKTAHELATAESDGNKDEARKKTIQLAFLVAQEKGTDEAMSFARMLQWGIDASLPLVMRERQKREEQFRELIEGK